MASSKRIVKELSDLQKTPIDGVEISLKEENIYKWTAKLKGPEGSPYSAGRFQLDIDFPTEYPFKAPKINFFTKIYHPNVDEEGNLCIGLLKSDNWKPSTKASTVILAIIQLLAEPAPDDALVASIAELYLKDRPTFTKNAKEYTKKYAVDK